MLDPFAGQRLGNYLLGERLGSGGMAAVYRASHVALGTEHAVKVLFPQYASHPEVRARFLREGRVQAQLQHPGIARVTDTINEGSVALVMELLIGESLREILARGPIPLDIARMIVEDVSGALMFAHSRGVVHRDIKPDNIFVAEVPAGLRPVLLDFGIARVHEMTTLTQTGVTIGTPRYMSLEQLEDPRTVDARSDVFSLAVVLYEMIHGVTPHPGETPHAIAMSILMGRRLAHRATPELETLFDRALSAEKGDRHGSIEEFARAVKAAVPDSRDVLSTSAPDPEPAPTWPPIPDEEVSRVLADRRAVHTVECPQCAAINPAARPLCRRCRTPLGP